MPLTTQYTSLLLDLERLDKTMREQHPQPTVTIYDTETSRHPVGQCNNDGTPYKLAERAAAA